MKKCSKCGVVKPVEGFDKKSENLDGLQYHCKECRKIYVNNHYLKNKAVYKEKAKRSRKKYTNKFVEYKRTLSCTDCGMNFKNEPFLCDFHHLDKNNKEYNVGLIRESVKKLDKEIKKCIPLCSNCHRRRHYAALA